MAACQHRMYCKSTEPANYDAARAPAVTVAVVGTETVAMDSALMSSGKSTETF